MRNDQYARLFKRQLESKRWNHEFQSPLQGCQAMQCATQQMSALKENKKYEFKLTMIVLPLRH